ncbi:hypothetical protein OR1_04040 [Geobacter sp. OR-1]|uniref:hypothetical protein n=1 Tax=Geobacter sp. OR-1 TaxID=1266765 RepID=UPI000542D373|nr:hypothetical protein [Geobacter sp. OR-1]GAM11724.1 hypothetical protein OR1_04040 [Geobacter sp. OR-1]
MKRMTRVCAIAIAVTMLTSISVPCRAAENPFVETFQSAFYGGLAGALVGGALLAFTKHPSDHLDYVGYGGAGGVLVGAAYGLAKASRSLAEYENGKVKFAIPTVIPELQEHAATGHTSVVFNAQLVRGTF